MVENENLELKSRMNEMVNERGSNMASAMDRSVNVGSHLNRPGVPLLNLSPHGGVM